MSTDLHELSPQVNVSVVLVKSFWITSITRSPRPKNSRLRLACKVNLLPKHDYRVAAITPHDTR